MGQVKLSFVETLVVDFLVGETIGIFYLSTKYAALNPTYFARRLQEWKDYKTLTVNVGKIDRLYLLLLADGESAKSLVPELSLLASTQKITVMVAFSADEAVRYLVTFHAYQRKTLTSLRSKVSPSSVSEQMEHALTSIPSVNKTDAAVLWSNFGSLKGLSEASEFQLKSCPGMGDKKVARIYSCFNSKNSSAQ